MSVILFLKKRIQNLLNTVAIANTTKTINLSNWKSFSLVLFIIWIVYEYECVYTNVIFHAYQNQSFISIKSLYSIRFFSAAIILSSRWFTVTKALFVKKVCFKFSSYQQTPNITSEKFKFTAETENSIT